MSLGNFTNLLIRLRMSGMKKVLVAFFAAASMVGSGFVNAFEKNIVETAVEAGKFKTLAAALTAAGLVDAVKGPGPFTVFAPSDEAFAKLPKGTVEALLKPENKDLYFSSLGASDHDQVKKNIKE